MSTKYKPGPGWSNVGGAVWDRDGVRIHTHGLVKFDGCEVIDMGRYPMSTVWDEFTAVCGGNRKRGLMSYARWCLDVRDLTLSTE